MKRYFTNFTILPLIILLGCVSEDTNELIFIEGGTFINLNSNYYATETVVNDFYIGRYEVTQKEWSEVMGNNPSQFVGDNLPVEMVSWYDCILYCNTRSLKEGLAPFYNINKSEKDQDNDSMFDDVKWKVTINNEANGFRLPTETEWEYAASGGKLSKGSIYGGNNDLDKIAWFWRNAGDSYLKGEWQWINIENNNGRTRNVGQKRPNELGLFDISGNVREWCWDWYADMDLESGYYRVWKGGGWIGGEHTCEISYRGKFEANGIGPDQGFRVARNAN